LLGVRRNDHIKKADLLDRAGIPSLNEIVFRQSAISAWRAVNSSQSPLQSILKPLDDRTRGGTNGHKKPVSHRCVAASNMTTVWNKFEELRRATSLHEAQKVAKKLAMSVKHF